MITATFQQLRQAARDYPGIIQQIRFLESYERSSCANCSSADVANIIRKENRRSKAIVDLCSAVVRVDPQPHIAGDYFCNTCGEFFFIADQDASQRRTHQWEIVQEIEQPTKPPREIDLASQILTAVRSLDPIAGNSWIAVNAPSDHPKIDYFQIKCGEKGYAFESALRAVPGKPANYETHHLQRAAKNDLPEEDYTLEEPLLAPTANGVRGYKLDTLRAEVLGFDEIKTLVNTHFNSQPRPKGFLWRDIDPPNGTYLPSRLFNLWDDPSIQYQEKYPDRPYIISPCSQKAKTKLLLLPKPLTPESFYNEIVSNRLFSGNSNEAKGKPDLPAQILYKNPKIRLNRPRKQVVFRRQTYNIQSPLKLSWVPVPSSQSTPLYALWRADFSAAKSKEIQICALRHLSHGYRGCTVCIAFDDTVLALGGYLGYKYYGESRCSFPFLFHLNNRLYHVMLDDELPKPSVCCTPYHPIGEDGGV